MPRGVYERKPKGERKTQHVTSPTRIRRNNGGLHLPSGKRLVDATPREVIEAGKLLITWGKLLEQLRG